MKIQNISFTETNAFPKMILDFLSGNDSLKSFYQYLPKVSEIPHIIKAKQKENINRDVLVRTILEQYAGLALQETLEANISSLSDSNTFCITTAHQLNLFTGPLYYIYKIACVINSCQHLKTVYPEYNFVPVYWMGSEDHDFEEINHVHVFGKTLEWMDKQGGATGLYDTASIVPLIEELKTMLGNLPFAGEWIELLQKAYAQPTLTHAARFLVHELFGAYGLVIVDGNCRALKAEFRTVMEDELLNQTSCRLVNEQLDKLSAAGYKQQAFPRDINLFYLDVNSRERIVLESTTFKVHPPAGRAGNSNKEFSKEEILAELEQFPERFSPNVILRPIFQQKILPSLAYIGGGGELSYWLQLKTLFEHFRVNFPQLILRNSVLYINSGQLARMQKLGIAENDIFKETEELKKAFVLRTAIGNLDLEAEKNNLSQVFEQVKSKAALTDATLVNVIGAEQQKALQGLENIEKRLMKALKQRNETELNQLEKLKQQLFPENILQERYDNFSSYYAAHGSSFIEGLIRELDPYQKEFLLIEE